MDEAFFFDSLHKDEKRECCMLLRAAAIFMNCYLLISFPSCLQGTLKVAEVITADCKLIEASEEVIILSHSSLV